jgi:hypothetical protein
MLPGTHKNIETETQIVKQTDKQKDMKNGIINQQKNLRTEAWADKE